MIDIEKERGPSRNQSLWAVFACAPRWRARNAERGRSENRHWMCARRARVRSLSQQLPLLALPPLSSSAGHHFNRVEQSNITVIGRISALGSELAFRKRARRGVPRTAESASLLTNSTTDTSGAQGLSNGPLLIGLSCSSFLGRQRKRPSARGAGEAWRNDETDLIVFCLGSRSKRETRRHYICST